MPCHGGTEIKGSMWENSINEENCHVHNTLLKCIGDQLRPPKGSYRRNDMCNSYVIHVLKKQAVPNNNGQVKYKKGYSHWQL